MDSKKIIDWIYFGTPEEQKRKAWSREVLRATAFLDEGLYSQEEFARKVWELRREYGVNKYSHNKVLSDFNN
jgi:uncharacterized protein YaeQ